MAFKVRKSGAWADTGTVKVMKSGAWATAGFVKVMKSGSWALAWPLLAASITDQDVSTSGSTGTNATVTYRVGSDGVVYRKFGASAFLSAETWLTSGSNSQFEVRFVLITTNGVGSVTGTLNTWLPTSSNNDIAVSGAPAGQIASREFTVEIREIISNTVLDTATVTMNAERT